MTKRIAELEAELEKSKADEAVLAAQEAQLCQIDDEKDARIAELEAACRAALASIGETERLTWASELHKQLTEALGGNK